MYYEGKDCQIKSDSLKTIKRVSTVSTVIAIISIVTIYATMFLADVHSHFFIKKAAIVKPKAREMKKFTYF
jgi:hypothetical protein